jgi:hypothetical protein
MPDVTVTRLFRGGTALVTSLACSCLLALACAGSSALPPDFASPETAAEEAAPLGGTSLGQRKRRMERMYRDLAQLQTSLDDVRHRADRSGLRQLGRFVDAYMGLHLEPLLRPEWQSRHPELMALDANLRLLQADVLIRIRERGRAQRVMDGLTLRFVGREDMLVDYPVGAQSTLGEAIEALREGKWRRPNP